MSLKALIELALYAYLAYVVITHADVTIRVVVATMLIGLVRNSKLMGTMLGNLTSASRQDILTSETFTTTKGEPAVMITVWNPKTFGRLTFTYDPSTVTFDETILTTTFRGKATSTGRQSNKGAAVSGNKREITLMNDYVRPDASNAKYLQKLQLQLIVAPGDASRAAMLRNAVRGGQILAYPRGGGAPRPMPYMK